MEKQSYLDRINAFWNWRMLNPVSGKAVALYFALLHCANRAGFPDEICVPNSTLLSMVDISKSDLYRTRNTLVQVGLIAINKGKKGQSAVYTLCSIVPKYGANPGTDAGTNPGTNPETNPGTNPGNIYGQRNKTGTKTEETPQPPQGALRGQEKAALFDEFWELYPRKVGKGAARKAWDKLQLTADLAEIIAKAIRKQRSWDQWTRDGGQYIPHPATWLNQQRWEDEGMQQVDAGQKEQDQWDAWIRGDIE